MSAVGMRTAQQTGLIQQMIAMLAALQHGQLIGGMERLQMASTEHQLPLHVGVVVPRTKVEQARQCQQWKWQDQRQAQVSTAMSTEHASIVLEAQPPQQQQTQHLLWHQLLLLMQLTW